MQHNHKHEFDDNRTDRFLRLLTPVQTRIYAYILSLWPNRVESEDILQETIATMWSKFDDYQSGTDFLAWGITIAKYSVMTYRNKARHTHSRFDEHTIDLLHSKTPQFFKKMDDQLDALYECMKKLPERHRVFVQLRYDKGLPAQKIADRFDISVRAVYKTLSGIHNALLGCVRQTLKAEGIQ